MKVLLSWLFWQAFVLSVVITQSVDTTLQGIVLLAAALAGLVTIYRLVVIPSVLFGRKMSKGVDLLFELADWRADVEHRLERIERSLEADVTVRHEVGPRRGGLPSFHPGE